MSTDLLNYHPAPRTPAFVAPVGAVDAHCHVFGPAAEFPFAGERKYTPNDAGKAALFALRDHLGFSRNVIVQASCHGKDNAAMVDALASAGELARGVAVVDKSISVTELQAMDRAGVRAVRFNFVKRLVDTTPWADFLAIAAKIEPLGWHIVVYFEAPDLAELIPLLRQFNCPVVIDHMGRPDIAAGVDADGFQAFIALLQDHPNMWTKVSCPERLSDLGPAADYADVVPFARTLVERFPDRVLWGTDWPHPNMTSHMPDDGQLVDVIPQIAPTADLQQQLLVDNPMRLYWSDGASR
jgi:2-pyrone-4,6-dicarboxylate lactonase